MDAEEQQEVEKPKEEVSRRASHETIIKKVYYDVETGFQSIAKTLKKAQGGTLLNHTRGSRSLLSQTGTQTG